MPLPNITTKIIAGGQDCIIRIGDSSANPQAIGLVTSAQYTETFSTQKANCIGRYGPVSRDPQDYDCTINVGSFVPFLGSFNGQAQYPGSGDTSIRELIPTRRDIEASGKPKGFPYMDFYNKKGNKILASFSGVTVESYNMSINGNSYVADTIAMNALEVLPPV